MTFYLIKALACSAVLLLVYIGWLHQEKMHRFNRFYLLGSIVFSFLVPLISIETTVPVAVITDVSEATAETITVINGAASEFARTDSRQFPWFTLLWAVYLGVSAFFLARFTRNMIKLYGCIKKYRAVKYKEATLVLLPWATVPHSFLNYIFFSEESYQQGNIPKEIWQHELTHVNQRHSIDILIIELMRVFLWFNPLLTVYRKMIRVNHEFLADEAVIKQGGDAREYQYLLVRPQHSMAGTFPASAFNYAVTKKRLLMISKTKSPLRAFAKQIMVLLPAAGLFLFCCVKTTAQDSIPKVVHALEAPFTQKGVSEELLVEYKSLTEKVINERKQPDAAKLAEAEKSRLQEIFTNMSKEQQSKQTIRFMKRPAPLPKKVPTAQQVEAWKNAKMYGLWINEKRVQNNVLNKYTASDFSQVFVSKLSKNTVNYGKHYYQIDLMTNEYYETYRKETLEEIKKSPLMMTIAWWKERKSK